MKFNVSKVLGGFGLKGNTTFLLAAAGIGGAIGYYLAKNGGVQGVFESNYAVPSNMVAMGYNSLRHPNLSDEHRWNTLPNPNMEISVPVDAFDRMATIQGAYGEGYSYVGTPS